MAFKVLLPVVVILLIYLLGRSHARRGVQRPAQVLAAGSSTVERWRTSFRLGAYALASLAVLTGGWMLYDDWHEARRVVVVRVINVQTGATIIYQATQAHIHGRTFSTTDGRQIRLADVERMEVDRDGE